MSYPTPASPSERGRAAGRTRPRAAVLAAVVLAAAPAVSFAAETGAEFTDAYTFVYEAATGYLGRGISITGGLIGLGIGAARGSALPAIIGVILAIFGALGPDIIDAIFGSAVI